MVYVRRQSHQRSRGNLDSLAEEASLPSGTMDALLTRVSSSGGEGAAGGAADSAAPPRGVANGPAVPSTDTSPVRQGQGGGEQAGSHSPDRRVGSDEGGGGRGTWLPEFQPLTDLQCQRELESAMASSSSAAPPPDPDMQPMLVRE